ncbi:HlyD family secretion protein [Synechococcus sp. AH-551-E02]|nr:HlyD family efflux transporter periplasmic adaptor subunit [Synechococcus sp. AH-551-E02]MDB4653297.1 HlyD family secretion protein [Synechococcus sp. AH-551-E02]
MKLNPFKLLDPDYKQDDKDASKYDESVLQQGRFWMRTVTWSLIGTTVFGVAWLAIARTEEIVVAKGQLEPVGSVQDIQMPVGGVVDDILVEEGETVKKGEILMKLDTEASEQQFQSLEASIKLKGVERNKYSEMNNAQIQMLEKNLTLQLEILDRYQQLEESGAASELQFLSQRNTVEETRGRLMQAKADRFRQLSLLDQQLAELKSRLAEVRVTLRYQQLKSPVDGVVFDLQPTATGFTAQSTQTVMKVVPFGALEAKVEVPSNKIGFVKIPVGCPKKLADCMNADISIDSYPSTDFGVIEGKVTSIASDALAPDQQEQRQEFSFPVTIQLNKQILQLKSGAKLPLQVGMSLTANIKLRKVSYLQLLLGEFQDKAESLQRL